MYYIFSQKIFFLIFFLILYIKLIFAQINELFLKKVYFISGRLPAEHPTH